MYRGFESPSLRMKKRQLSFAVFTLIIMASLCGCSEAKGKMKLVLGNFYFSRGMYIEAVGAYLEAVNYESEASYAEYALGCSYLAMEQSEAALSRFQNAEKKAVLEEKKELIYRIRYNCGVVRFKTGDMLGAATDFKRALIADGSRMSAKLNLELSTLSLLRQNESAEVRTTQKGSVTNDDDRRKREILFNYVRQKETDKWKSWEWSGETDDSTQDY
ncbi:MAG: hypothetical protein Ta2G_07270 [Termitinemataceae bacterium]|nr:MAG: hypothetical protein Ta2G_07270 [Termitinemataceae bacterium]